MDYFVFTKSFLQNQYFQANINNLNNISKSVEYFLSKTDDIAKYYSILDKETISFAYKDIEINSTFLSYFNRLKSQRLVDDSINSVYFYYKLYGKLLDLRTGSIYSIKDEGSEENKYLQSGNFYDLGWLNSLKSNAYNKYGFMLLNTRKQFILKDEDNPTVYEKTIMNIVPNADVITVIRPIKNLQNNGVGDVVVNLNESVLSQYIKNAHMDNPQTTFIINTDGNIVSNEDKSLLGKNIMYESYIKTIINGKNNEGFLTDKIDGQKSAVIYIKSGYVNWIYLSVIPYSYIIENLNYLNSIIFTIIILILISAVISAYFQTKKMYTPIENIFKKIISFSNSNKTYRQKSELKVIDNMLDNFKQNYDRMDKVVFDNFFPLKYNFINKLIAGECEAEEKENGLNEYKINLDKNFLFIVNIDIDEFSTVMNNYKVQDIYLMKQAIINIAEEVLNAEYIAIGTNISQRYISIIINTDNRIEDKNKLIDYFNNIAEFTKKTFKLSISFGIGNTYCSIEDLKISSNEAVIALSNKLNKGKNAIIYFDEINDSEDFHNNTDYNDQLINLIRSGQKDKCMHVLEDQIRTISEKNLNRYQIENIFMELIILIRRQLNNNDTGFENICSHKFSDVLGFIDSVETLDALKSYLENIFTSLCNYYTENKKNLNEEFISRVMNYIEKHYCEELSLDIVSSTLKLTPQYISKLIKDITGVNFLEYLTNLRIKKSEQLLLKSDLSVKEIAEKVGYACYRTYLQQFKAYTGMIPTQYRKFKNDITND